MKNKKLNLAKLIVANIFILFIFIFILLIVPNKPEINVTILVIYVSFATYFNLFITDKE